MIRISIPFFGVMLAGVIGILAVVLGEKNGFLFDALRFAQSFEQTESQVQIVFPTPIGSGTLAHYTEHLAWLPNIGKDSRPENRDTNAWTNDYALGYWLSGPPEDLPDMLRRLKVVFDPIDLPQEFAVTERDIILRKYDWRMANNPDAQAAEEMEALFYDGTGRPCRSAIFGAIDAKQTPA